MDKKKLIKKSVFVLSLLSVITQAAAHSDAYQAKDKKGYEKCVGVAATGKNDCAALDGSHMCAGLSETDKSPTEWRYVKKGTCLKLGGKIMAKKPTNLAQ